MYNFYALTYSFYGKVLLSMAKKKVSKWKEQRTYKGLQSVTFPKEMYGGGTFTPSLERIGRPPKQESRKREDV